MGTSSGDGRFDYVVVGAGSAGCVLARRLTEDPDLRVLLLEAYHPTSSAAMGPNDDDPLDLELRVRGIDRLRVVDASAMPAIPRGNTNAPTIALAERAVDLIRGAAAQPQQQTEQIAEFAGGAQ